MNSPGSSTRNSRQHGTAASGSPTHEFPQQEQENIEIPIPEGKPQQDVCSPPGSEAHVDVVITSIRATNLYISYGRIPAGFYVVVGHSGYEWRTDNKPLMPNNDVVEWSGPIPIPSDLSATVSLAVHASFELQPVLGSGERLRVLTVTVEQLLDNFVKHLHKQLKSSDACRALVSETTFTFSKGENDKSPCSSLLITVRQRENNLSASDVLTPHRPAPVLQAQIEGMTDQGYSALSQYRRHKEGQDLERAIEQFQDVLDICSLNNPCYAAALSNLAMAKFLHCQAYDNDAPLDISVMLYRNALLARPVPHPDRARTLLRLAVVLFAQFEKQQDEAHVAGAKALLLEAVELSPAESHEHQAAYFLLKSHDKYGVEAVQASTSQLSVLQGLVPSLTTSLRFLHSDTQFSGHIHQSIERSNITDALPSGPNFAEQDSLEGASLQQDVMGLYPDSHSSRASYLSLLPDPLGTFTERFGDVDNSDETISRQRAAVNIPDRHPDKPGILDNLGNSLQIRFERRGKLSDLEEAISRHQDAVRLAPDSHPAKPDFLDNLCISIMTRFQCLRRLSDLEEGLAKQRDAVRLTPDSHPDKPCRLSYLGDFLQTHFECSGKPSDLEEAISIQWDAVRLAPDSHPHKPRFLNDLGASLITRFECLGGLCSLEEAIANQRDAVRLTPDGHPDRLHCLTNLGSFLQARFEHLGRLPDLEEVIARKRDAVHLTLDGHPDKPHRLNNLGNSFQIRFEHLGKLIDLEKAISRQRDAFHLTLDGHPNKPGYLNNLGTALGTRFERFGELGDLEEAIVRQRDAVCLTPDGHPDKPGRLSNLSNSLSTRFNRLGELNDLEEAISRQRDAVHLTPEAQSRRPGLLNNLGIYLHARFKFLGELSDLEEAIMRQRDAIHRTLDGHPGKPGYLNSLSTTLITRFECLEEPSDLEEAISKQRAAVHLIPDGQPDKPGCLSNLGIMLVAHFKRLKKPGYLEEAISRQRNAVHLIPDGHPAKPELLVNLADSLLTRHEHLGERGDFDEAVLSLSLSACSLAGSIGVRFAASLKWASCCRLSGQKTLLQAYSVVMHLLPQLAWIGLSLAHRYRELIGAADVVRDAAAAALDCGQPETAVEWLEQGRSIVWGEMFQLRSSYDKLSSAYPGHARKLRELSAALEDASATREKFKSPLMELSSSTERPTAGSLQQVADKHRKLAIERDKLLRGIRTLPGFERFLLHKEFSQLRAAALSGPVVMLNAAETRCDALIILAAVDHVVHVPLPNFTPERCGSLQASLSSVRRVRAMRTDDRDGQPVPQEKNSHWQPILASLWKCVAKPVLDALALSIPGELPRIFWCPTGPFTFLPIHAAGFYDTRHTQPGYKVHDFIVSSYVPTLSILTPSLEHRPASTSNTRLLVVRQPASDGLRTLPGVAPELEHIRMAAKNYPSARIILSESSVGTVEEVLSLMKEADWVHFACHGVQDSDNPTESGLCLADQRRLRLSDVISLSRPRGGLAFLSACQTAKGDEDLSDEAIHIAAGMLFVGYGGIIGSMWSISDRYAPDVTKDVYEQLFSSGTRPDYREAARALHVAVGRLRDKSVPFIDWVPFIHVGL